MTKSNIRPWGSVCWYDVLNVKSCIWHGGDDGMTLHSFGRCFYPKRCTKSDEYETKRGCVFQLSGHTRRSTSCMWLWHAVHGCPIDRWGGF
uniref:Uncharacterized protein n=1 Tax=Anguilla anguilla TaxID=7936 RepID=A0A0E9S4E8_ANGAN